MKIRKLEQKDIKEIVEYEKEYFDTSLGFDFILNELKNPYANYLVILEDDKLKGYIGTNIDEYGEILNFFIVKDSRNKGFGHALFDEALKYFKNCKSISLEVKSTNIGAIEFYKSYGFQIDHVRKGYYKGIDAYLMIKRLDV